MSPRVWVITGTSRGLGLEFVKQLSKDPNNVVFALARKPDSSKELLSLVGPHVHIVKADTSILSEIEAAVKEVSAKTDYVDVLINNAGISLDGVTPKGPTETDASAFTETFRVNVVGVVMTTNAFIPLLKAGKEKKVIQLSSNLSSISQIVPKEGEPDSFLAPVAPSYSTSKAALNMVNAKYAYQFKDEGFIFSAIHPGWVATDMGSHHAPLSPEQSITRFLEIVENLTPKDTGKLLSVDDQTYDF